DYYCLIWHINVWVF
nr:immunoglobulin light chain junction region [Macaca mulatta]MOX23261.1 immunoglobulin light chain junction region [Macaca mulatta]